MPYDAERVGQLRKMLVEAEAEAIRDRLIARQGIAGGRDDPSHQMRRKAAIERVTSAMQAEGLARRRRLADRHEG
jgi:hypothetical protein